MNFRKLIVVAVIVQLTLSTVFIKTLTLTQTNQIYTVTFIVPFTQTPTFTYFIESGKVKASQFAVTHGTSTTLSKTQLVIELNIHIVSWIASDSLTLSLLVTDQHSTDFNIGMVALDIATSRITFSSFAMSRPTPMLAIYPLALPTQYSSTSNNTNNYINFTFSQKPTTYFQQGLINFAYIYFTNAYSANRVVTLFPYVTQQYYGYQLNYSPFTYTPQNSNLILALNAYSSTSNPFLKIVPYKDFTSNGQDPDSFVIGYNKVNDPAVLYSADVFMINTTQSCPEGEFLYYITYYSSLPLECRPCHSSCATCLVPDIYQNSNTNSTSCMSCPYLRYFNPLADGYGSCPCYTGLQEIDGVCIPCQINCLTFKVVYIQSTNQTNYLLYFSMPSIIQQIALGQNMAVTINGKAVQYQANKQSDSIYRIVMGLSDISICQGIICSVQFLIHNPNYILTPDGSRSLSHNNVTVSIQGYVNYDTIVPQEVQQAFRVIGMITAGSYSSGFASMLKMLFQLNQVLDFHKYLNLTLPVIFNQLVEDLSPFRFLDLTILLPSWVVDNLKDVTPNTLDQMGPPKLIYYDSGINFFKNIITGFISCAVMLLFNLMLYLLLRKLPFKVTHKFARKLKKRKIITIHDTLEQLVLPVLFFAMTQLHYLILNPELSWVYGLAAFSAVTAIVAPFLLILFVLRQRGKEEMQDVYQDLLHDNDMSLPITYIYFVFNYCNKLFFALCLTYTLPGLVQIYLLATTNILFLAFTIYLVVNNVYRSKSKIFIKLVNTSSIIIVEMLIVIYNVNDYDNQTNVNIGMTCFYLCVVTTILGIIDAIIKIFQTILQEVGTKKVYAEPQKPTNTLLKQFRNQIVCKLGQDLAPINRDPKVAQFKLDKEIMEHTFNPDQNQSQLSEPRLQGADTTKGDLEVVDLVYIDDNWQEVYPQPRENNSLQNLYQWQQPERVQNRESNPPVELYEIPQEISQQAKRLAKRRSQQLVKRGSKYQVQQQYQQLSSHSTTRRRRHKPSVLQVKPINQSREQQMSQI